MPLASQPVTEISELGETWKRIISFLVSPQLQENVFWLKIALIIISLVFLAVIIYLLFTTSFLDYWMGFSLKNFLTAKYLPGKKAQKKWQKIKRRMERGGEANLKLAVIEASQLLQKVLAKKGYGEENLLWQLKRLTEDEVSNIDELRGICSVYENILRDPDYRLEEERASKILENIETALKDLEVF